jgi:hypothetical protein
LLELSKADVDEDLKAKYPIKSALLRTADNVLRLLPRKKKKPPIRRCQLSLFVTPCEWNAYVDVTASLYCTVLPRLQFSEWDMLCIAGKAETHINIYTAMDAVLLARV